MNNRNHYLHRNFRPVATHHRSGKILTAKKANPQTDTSAWEREIDGLVYGLYGLTEEEIAVIERV